MVPFLDQIEEEHPASDITLGNTDNEAKVRFCELIFRFLVAFLHALGELDFFVRLEQRHAADLLEIHAHRIVNADVIWNGKIELDLLFFLDTFEIVLGRLEIVVIEAAGIVLEGQPELIELLKQDLHFIRREIHLAQGIADLFVCKLAFFLTKSQ